MLERVSELLREFEVRPSRYWVTRRAVHVDVAHAPVGFAAALAQAVDPLQLRLRIIPEEKLRKDMPVSKIYLGSAPDELIGSVIRGFCGTRGRGRAPRDLAKVACLRLDDGDSPREVGQWLLGELDSRGRPAEWLRLLLRT